MNNIQDKYRLDYIGQVEKDLNKKIKEKNELKLKMYKTRDEIEYYAELKRQINQYQHEYSYYRALTPREGMTNEALMRLTYKH